MTRTPSFSIRSIGGNNYAVTDETTKETRALNLDGIDIYDDRDRLKLTAEELKALDDRDFIFPLSAFDSDPTDGTLTPFDAAAAAEHYNYHGLRDADAIRTAIGFSSADLDEKIRLILASEEITFDPFDQSKTFWDEAATRQELRDGKNEMKLPSGELLSF